MDQSIENLLDSTLDDLADMPAFRAYIAGAHRAALSLEIKEVSNKTCVEAKLKLFETLEQADLNEAPMEAGTEANVLYQLDNEFGQGKLKELLKPLAAHFGTNSNRETIAATKNVEVLAVTKVRNNKKTGAEYQEYTDIVSVQVL